MAMIEITQRQFTITLNESDVNALYLALKGARMLAVTSPAYKLKNELKDALGYEPTEDIY